VTDLRGSGRQAIGRRRTAWAWAILAGVPLLAGCGSGAAENTVFTRLGMPAPATEEAPTILRLWQGSWLVAVVVAIIVWGALAAALLLYRRRRTTEVPEQTRYNIPIEVLYTVVPLVVVIGLFAFTARDQARLTSLSENPDQVVNVIGFRWGWTFNYVTEGTFTTGTPGDRPVLYLPVDQRVRFELTSPDVIHSFWIPAFLYKMDVIPGRVNEFEVTPNVIGTYPGRCAELCGVDHARMLFTVKVLSQADFDAQMAALREQGNVGLLDSERVITDANPDCTIKPGTSGCEVPRGGGEIEGQTDEEGSA